MTTRPWPDTSPGLFGSVAERWRKRRERRYLAAADRRAASAAAEATAPAVPEPEHHRKEYQTALPSSMSFVDFQASFTVVWTLDGRADYRHAIPQSTAVNAIVQRAAAITRQANPVHHKPLREQLAFELGKRLQVENTNVWARAEDVHITVEEADLDLVRRHVELNRRRELRQAERELERAELRYLRDNVFNSVGNALLWWLHHNDNQIERIGEVAPQLTQLVRLVSGQEQVHWADNLLAALEEASPGGLGEAQRLGLAGYLGQVLGEYGGPGAKDEFETRAKDWGVGRGGPREGE
ncbi:hypothetical protein [Goodfellowiella coeruleoviolacea]|uniref:Uncharacterized protein n=1 Tax=Goodfellowiella coeruleoviolacea TaxID=334858 RepID=A0AAE3GI56_9PSEU|nr:hypothetical protein [Goodfellowiella coeruleoviolacea]MCP2168661.1 hypothetical protein [Goodfellowiella coeruleoviolacea]